MTRNTRLHYALSIAAIPSLVLIFCARLAVTGQIIAHGDAFTYFYPYWHAASEALSGGRLPLWNDKLFLGAPFLANGQTGLLYPPNWFVWAVGSDAPAALNLSILMHLTWAGLGTLVLLRAAMRLGLQAAVAGAALYAVGGALTTHAAQINQLQGLAWLPWLFALLDLARRRPGRWGPLLAGALAMQVLTGHTQTVFISVVGLAAAALWWAWRDGACSPRRGRFGGLIVLLLAGGAAALLALPLLAPMLELSGLSNRAGGLPINEVVSFSLHPFMLGRALLPNYDVPVYGEFIATVGIAGLALAVLGAWWARKDAHWQAWLVVMAVGLVLGVGKWNQFYWQLGKLPGFNLFRVPPRWLALWGLGAAVLAAYALDRLAKAGEQDKNAVSAIPRWLLGVFGAGVAALVGVTYLAPKAKGLDVSGLVEPQRLELFAWLVTLLIVLGVLARGRAHAVAGILSGLALGELFVAAYLMPMPFNRLTAREAFTEPRVAIQYMLDHAGDGAPARYLSIAGTGYIPADSSSIEAAHADLRPEAMFDLLEATKLKDVVAPNLGMVWRLPSVDGFGGGVLPLEAYTAFTGQQLVDQPATDGRLRETMDGVTAEALAWLAGADVRYIIVEPSVDIVDDEWMLVAAGDVKLYAFTGESERTRLVLPPESGEPVSGTATITEYAPEALTIVTDSPRDGALWLMDTYYPGWRATIDGEPVQIERVAGNFRQVQVPAGEHVIEMTFRPTSWPAALVVGGVAWIGLAGAVLWGVRSRRGEAQEIP
jgi:hypothetical protein